MRYDHEYPPAIVDFIRLPLVHQQTRSFDRFLSGFERSPGTEPEPIAQQLEDSIEAAYSYIDLVSRFLPAHPSRRRIRKRWEATYLSLKSSQNGTKIPVANLVIYYFALDTPLSKALLDDSNYVKQSRRFDNFEVVSDFFASAIPTVATLLRHIVHFDCVERKVAKERSKTLQEKLFQVFDPGQTNEVIDDFEIKPLWETTIRNAVRFSLKRDPAEKVKQASNAVKQTRQAMDMILNELDRLNG